MSRTAGDNLSRQNEGIKKFNDGVAEQKELQDKLFLENAAMVAADSEGMPAAPGLWIMHGRLPE